MHVDVIVIIVSSGTYFCGPENFEMHADDNFHGPKSPLVEN